MKNFNQRKSTHDNTPKQDKLPKKKIAEYQLLSLNKSQLSKELDDEVMKKIIALQDLIQEKKQQYISVENIIQFLNNAMNYGEFQIWLLDNQIEGINLSFNDELKKFLSETSPEKILILYDIDKNYNDKNIDNIEKYIEKEPKLKKTRK